MSREDRSLFQGPGSDMYWSMLIHTKCALYTESYRSVLSAPTTLALLHCHQRAGPCYVAVEIGRRRPFQAMDARVSRTTNTRQDYTSSHSWRSPACPPECTLTSALEGIHPAAAYPTLQMFCDVLRSQGGSHTSGITRYQFTLSMLQCCHSCDSGRCLHGLRASRSRAVFPERRSQG